MEFRAFVTMLIQSDKVNLQLFEREHLYDPSYHRWLRDADVVRYIGREELLEGVSFAAIEDYVKGLWADENIVFLAVQDRETDNFIGTAKIRTVDEQGMRSRYGDIGIMLGDRSCWGRGLATEVLRCVSRYAFDNLNVPKLTAGAMSPNTAVIRAFRRIGYVEEGRLRRQFFFEGSYCDHVLLGCLRGELR